MRVEEIVQKYKVRQLGLNKSLMSIKEINYPVLRQHNYDVLLWPKKQSWHIHATCFK